ncbi:lipopolysaccharide biosynthesis protein [Jatrophihabitans telluris]|uniref:Lipopolysaccharide biosynthesis protein n=1 Tax=Jatrophihabitans telluris TaxID=2038343 RepID=A0ABY4R0Q8_9ACTN|nr:lipopolysaccharide biosynthesis protein [Jatrophihabitans telluris]UQX89360.1 lipopolysaccharide biosynthesis protein [Jatrophihabitans telluris]
MSEVGSLTAPPDKLGRRTARGALVTLGGQLSQVLLQMTAVIALARLLSPHDYGLYAMVLVIAGIGEIFRDFGLSSAAIQAKQLSDAERSNLFWINAGIGALLTAIVFLSAPLVAALFSEHQLVPIARVLSVIFLINGCTTQLRANLNRNMRFGMLTVADLAAQVVNVTVAITCAALGAHYWALVGSQIAQVATVLVLVTIFGRWIPGGYTRGIPMGRFLRFGGNFVATQLVNYVSNNVDSLTIGLRFGTTPLGIYNRAFQLLMNPLNQFRTPATTVALPVLSRLQDDPVRAGDYIRRGQIAFGYTVVAGLAFVVGAAAPLVDFLLGSKWHEVPTILALLAVAGAFQMLSFVGYWIYLSRGLTRDLFRYTLISFAIKVTCILVGSTWGLKGVAAGYAIAPAISWPISLWWLSSRTPIPTRALLVGAGRILTCAGAAALATFLASSMLAHSADLLRLVAGLLACIAVYALAAVVKPVRADLATVVEFGKKVFS